MDLDLRAELAVHGLRARPPVRRRAGAGPSDDGHWSLGDGASATLPMAEDSPFELREGGVLTRDGVVVEDALLEPVLRPRYYDLRSRLAWGLVYQLHRLDDDEKDAALAQRAADHGFMLNAEVRRYLLTHFSRDLSSLMRMVDALDRHARESHRAVTVPLIRDFLQRSIDFAGPARP